MLKVFVLNLKSLGWSFAWANQSESYRTLNLYYGDKNNLY